MLCIFCFPVSPRIELQPAQQLFPRFCNTSQVLLRKEPQKDPQFLARLIEERTTANVPMLHLVESHSKLSSSVHDSLRRKPQQNLHSFHASLSRKPQQSLWFLPRFTEEKATAKSVVLSTLH